METSPTHAIVQALTNAIAAQRLRPGTRLVEQTLADHFGVSRTLVRQALFQLAQKRLVTLKPARGAVVATPSIEEARQVFAVRRMLEAEMTRQFVRAVSPAKLKALRAHVQAERAALAGDDSGERTQLLGDFHVCMAKLLDNAVLAQLLDDLIARCTLITLMYQSGSAAAHSLEEHADIVAALTERDEARAVQLMQEHLHNVEAGLAFDRAPATNALAAALAPASTPA